MKYTVDYFIEKFEAIPEKMWCRGQFVSGEKRCANGHCGVTDENAINNEAKALVAILEPLKEWTWPEYGGMGIFEVTANINDGYTKYRQETPKHRILAALYDIKAMNKPKDIEPATKTKTVYVAVPTTISEQANG